MPSTEKYNSHDTPMVYILIFLLLVFMYLMLDYKGPDVIPLKPAIVFGMVCFRAKDLIVQEYDDWGNLWATRGMIIYKLPKGENRFKRIARVSTGLSIFWLFNFSIIRKLTQKLECIEITVSVTGNICAFSAGYMWHGENNSNRFTKAMKLPHFGIGTGRGVLSNGLLKVNHDLLLFGEYFRNEERTGVNIYSSKDFGRTWDRAFEFGSGRIRHIHALQKDPYAHKVWICTGDRDNESMIGWSSDSFRNIDFIGQGSQVWRSCHLVFTEESIYWGTDTDSEDLSGIYRWDRHNRKLSRLLAVDGAIFYGTRLANGTIVMSSDREGFPNEKDDRTKLYVIKKQHMINTIACGTWNHRKKGIRFSFAKLRFQRNQGSDYLVMNILNQKEIPDAELIVIPQEEIERIAQ